MRHAIRGHKWLVATAAAAAMLTASAWASAAPTHYVTNFTSLNGSGVTGHARLTLDGNQLTVHIDASGLTPNQPHPQHIHGTFDADSNPTQAATPTIAQDTNGDGAIEVLEGAATYGPILIPLTSPPGGAVADFPVAADGTIDFTQQYDLTDSSIFNADYSEGDLMPLDYREIVLHGMFATTDISNAGLNGDTSYATGDYVATLPVASGVLVAAVPEPAEWGMMTGGLSLLLGLMWLRRRKDGPRQIGA